MFTRHRTAALSAIDVNEDSFTAIHASASSIQRVNMKCRRATWPRLARIQQEWTKTQQEKRKKEKRKKEINISQYY